MHFCIKPMRNKAIAAYIHPTLPSSFLALLLLFRSCSRCSVLISTLRCFLTWCNTWTRPPRRRSLRAIKTSRILLSAKMAMHKLLLFQLLSALSIQRSTNDRSVITTNLSHKDV
ncbi:hypothetical protein M433DRAFT_323366 [Acidomyces richmondensis BFW]|nr:MAG: hypothetical protein FE78DRAFT_492574 [Acidomyces sp. 'richmondensis']KYG49355.1 hypothetical protein M433DRAFT_323366 [Acidomyces richmondensis BFW]